MLAIDTAAYRSPWRRHHPAVKGVLFGGLLTCALALPPWPAAALVAATVLVVLLGPAAVPPRALLRAAWIPLTFILTGAAPLLVSVAGPEGLIAWAPGGAERAARLCGRAAAAVLCQLGFAFTTPLADLLPRLSRLGLPRPLVDVVMLIYRTLFLVLDSARRVQASQAGRLGYQTRRGWIRSLGALGSAVLVRSLDRARRMQRGVESRGYTGSLTVLVPPLPLRARAVGAAALPSCAVAAASLPYGFL